MILPVLIATLACRINRHQAHGIRYLREENRILKAKLKGKRISLTDTERRRLAVLAHPIERKQLKDLSTIATPDTLRRWPRRLVVHAPSRLPKGKPRGRPGVVAASGFLKARLSPMTSFWTVVTRLGWRLHVQGSHLFGLICHSILRVPTLVAQPWPAPWPACLTYGDARGRFVFSRRQRILHGSYPPARFVSAQPIPSQSQVSRLRKTVRLRIQQVLTSPLRSGGFGGREAEAD